MSSEVGFPEKVRDFGRAASAPTEFACCGHESARGINIGGGIHVQNEQE
jgi:hypothetical protein